MLGSLQDPSRMMMCRLVLARYWTLVHGRTHRAFIPPGAIYAQLTLLTFRLRFSLFSRSSVVAVEQSRLTARAAVLFLVVTIPNAICD